MSRRRQGNDYLKRNDMEPGLDRTYVVVEWMCPACEIRTGQPHRLGKIVRQRGRDMLDRTLSRIDGPEGETKVSATCPTCLAYGVARTPQARWDKLAAILDEMEAGGEHRRQFSPL